MFLLGYTPLSPSQFAPDKTSPALEHWFLDRQRGQLHLKFDEPISIFKASKIYLYLSIPLSFSNATAVSAHPIVTYEDEATRAVLDLQDLCFAVNDSNLNKLYFPITDCRADSFLGKVSLLPSASLYLSLDTTAAGDRALKPNYVAPISFTAAMKEGAPGIYQLHILYA